MKTYYQNTGEDINEHMPLTFLVTGGIQDPSFLTFKSYFQKTAQNNQNNQWILKPGEFSNRGKGIKLTQKLHTIEKYVENRDCCVIQKYIHNPLLLCTPPTTFYRKFDIR
jgi:tubulin polyglutamylase TTLL1